MTDSNIYFLDFRNGTVREVDNSSPPRGLSGPVSGGSHDPVRGKGYVLAALGSPPSSSDGEE